jgi:F420-dependent oxidoreductase-like protein
LGKIEDILALFREAEEEGFDTAWVGQLSGLDALSLVTLAGPVTRRMELGTFVIPVAGRSPVALAQQALTAQLASEGRLCVGVGAGHASILDKRLGLPTDAPVARTREFLEVFRRLMRGDSLKYEGRYHRVRLATPVEGAEPPGVVLGALGPRMLDLAENRSDGAAVVFAGARFIEEEVRPRMNPTSRIVLGIPMLITREVALTRRRIDEHVARVMELPAYARVLRAQGVSGLGELAIVGDPEELLLGLDDLEQAGVTDVNLIQIHLPEDPDAIRRTRQVLGTAARRRSGEAAR